MMMKAINIYARGVLEGKSLPPEVLNEPRALVFKVSLILIFFSISVVVIFMANGLNTGVSGV